MPENNNFNVLDMVDQISAEENIDASELFSKHETTEQPVQHHDNADIPAETSKKKEWTPNPELIKDMPELQQAPGAVYGSDEVRFDGDEPLRNLNDDDAVAATNETLTERDRQLANIKDAMARNGIAYFQIPDNHLDGGIYHVRIMTAAGDRNYQKGQAELDAIFADIIKLHAEWVHKTSDEGSAEITAEHEYASDDEFPTVYESDKTSTTAEHIEDTPVDSEEESPIISIKLDKSQVSQVSWTQEELEKIKKSRTVELNIVESSPIEFSSIREVDGSGLDSILDTYMRKTNDNIGVLPASQYRATFTGLSYAEVIDLSSSVEMNNLDGEKKKWSICFNHLKNPSIGPWESYVLYTDPETGMEKHVESIIDVPDGVDDSTIHRVSCFEDFLRKTSYLDLEFMLWKILCATAMNREIITITCRAKNGEGTCNNEYDWVYNPAELLKASTIDSGVLEAMKKTGEADSIEKIMAHYKESPVVANNTVTLPNSKIVCVYGHISAYDYINSVYELTHELAAKSEHDPSDISTMLAYRSMFVVKFFLVPTGDQSYVKVSKIDGMMKIFNMLNEIDWQVIAEITDMMTTPYAFQYAMREVKCPKCGNVTSIPIDSMERLLFIVTQSLNSVNVTLKKI